MSKDNDGTFRMMYLEGCQPKLGELLNGNMMPMCEVIQERDDQGYTVFRTLSADEYKVKSFAKEKAKQ